MNLKNNMGNILPNKLSIAEQVLISKFAWHRVINGKGNLIVEIEKF
jgi:hypothetical protein